jgi:hypothetical protein
MSRTDTAVRVISASPDRDAGDVIALMPSIAIAEAYVQPLVVITAAAISR